jgi:hypothetical protein
LQVTFTVPSAAPVEESIPFDPFPLIVPDVALKLYVKVRFCGLTPIAVIVDESPEITTVGLAEQLTVGGSNAFKT